jgi:hypothetical protein
MEKDERFVHSLKAVVAILVTEVGRDTVGSPLHP